MSWRGVQGEVLASLGLVMLTATALLAAFFLKTHTAQVDRLQGLLGRALVEEARSPMFVIDQVSPEISWWTVLPGEGAREKTPGAGPLDDDGLALAAAARDRGDPLLEAGTPWEPIRFAVRIPATGGVAVAHIPAAVSPGTVAALLLADALIFMAFGAYLLRRRVIVPLRLLAQGARSLSDGDLATRVPIEGVDEAAEVGRAFNEMSEALELRTGDLEKAVCDLRDANQTLRQARAGLDRAERLAAVGRLAAGVAHEVGNPMGALLAFLDLAARDEGVSEEGRGHLRRAAGEGERVRRILRQLLDFSRPPRATSVALDVGTLAEQTVGLLRAQKKYAGIAVEIDVAEGTPQALGDESLVVQVLLNLLINAGDAIRDRGEPRIRIAIAGAGLQVREGDDASAAEARRRPDAVTCEVSDNGPGIAEEDRERIFDPFFTTKAPGEGTGLGLANAQRVAEELGGALELSDSALGGATFELRLPAYGATSAGARETARGASARED